MNNQIIEEVINITLEKGEKTTSLEVKSSADDTEVIAVAVYHSGIEDLGIVNLGIEAGGKQVSKLQHIDNYRSRESSYLENKPCFFESGLIVRLEIQADEAPVNFDFKSQIILIKRKKNC